MSDVEQIAAWLETLHCNKWRYGPGCKKQSCVVLRLLAEKVRAGEWKA